MVMLRMSTLAHVQNCGQICKLSPQSRVARLIALQNFRNCITWAQTPAGGKSRLSPCVNMYGGIHALTLVQICRLGAAKIRNTRQVRTSNLALSFQVHRYLAHWTVKMHRASRVPSSALEVSFAGPKYRKFKQVAAGLSPRLSGCGSSCLGSQMINHVMICLMGVPLGPNLSWAHQIMF